VHFDWLHDRLLRVVKLGGGDRRIGEQRLVDCVFVRRAASLGFLCLCAVAERSVLLRHLGGSKVDMKSMRVHFISSKCLQFL
jgi:hypothetical protein